MGATRLFEPSRRGPPLSRRAARHRKQAIIARHREAGGRDPSRPTSEGLDRVRLAEPDAKAQLTAVAPAITITTR
jgi:hypothetical protein